VKENKAEYYAVLIILTMGMIMLASSNDLIMVYLALETVSIASYILTGWMSHSRRSSEASLKYVLYGAVASGLMLYGLSLLYGMTGSTDFHQVADKLASGPASITAGIAAMLVFCGFAYKIAAVPFHMWAPDVYTGAPTPVTAFLTVGPKAAGFAAMIRFFYVVLAVPAEPGAAGAMWTASQAASNWPMLIGLLSIATMTVGNFSALYQTNVKRLLGYSSIAHAGYMLMGMVVLSQEGLRSVLFYLVVYCAMNLGAFVVVSAVSNETGSEELESFRGLGTRNPLSAIFMTMFLFSLIGLPPLAGFAGKLHLFYGVVHAGMMAGTRWNFYYLLAVVGVLNSVVSLFYYARIVKAMYLETVPEKLAATPLFVRPGYYGLYIFLGFFTLYLGLAWGPWLVFADKSVQLMGSL
ncbi:MAG TPA: NADH-quinone oxidoreductase subunit N, partial [Terriglobales bacterium]|nr:NADH-quinone oxidoreductase subunit N [Terriglobales bacterium]